MQFHVRRCSARGRRTLTVVSCLKKRGADPAAYLPTSHGMLMSVCVLDYADLRISPRRASPRPSTATFAVLIFVGQKMCLKPPGVEQAGCMGLGPQRNLASATHGNVADIVGKPVLLFRQLTCRPVIRRGWPHPRPWEVDTPLPGHRHTSVLAEGRVRGEH